MIYTLKINARNYEKIFYFEHEINLVECSDNVEEIVRDILDEAGFIPMASFSWDLEEVKYTPSNMERIERKKKVIYKWGVK